MVVDLEVVLVGEAGSRISLPQLAMQNSAQLMVPSNPLDRRHERTMTMTIARMMVKVSERAVKKATTRLMKGFSIKMVSISLQSRHVILTCPSRNRRRWRRVSLFFPRQPIRIQKQGMERKRQRNFQTQHFCITFRRLRLDSEKRALHHACSPNVPGSAERASLQGHADWRRQGQLTHWQIIRIWGCRGWHVDSSHGQGQQHCLDVCEAKLTWSSWAI